MKVEETRNLVIFGNGFDLAHGQKTSYENFLVDYFLKNFEKAVNSKNQDKTGMYEHEDILFRFRIVDNGDLEYLKRNCKSLSELKEIIVSRPGLFKIDSLTPFSTAIYDKKDRWVDIEGIYYRQLRIIFQNNSIAPTNNAKKKLFVELNHGMNYLKKNLKIYLQNHFKEKKPKKIIEDLFFVRHLFDEENKLNGASKLAHKEKHHFYFLNFNYTDTTSLYRNNEFSKEMHIDINHIHGQVDHPDNPIIFGYGDEKDKNYKGIEDLEIDEAFENIKSFGYLQNDNYQNLLGFINGGKFNVIIIGHSCGLSDRTLLSTIFEHKDCEKIRVCYYEKDGWNDFTNKTYQISRHFDDKKILRKRIMSPKNFDRIPQYTDLNLK